MTERGSQREKALCGSAAFFAVSLWLTAADKNLNEALPRKLFEAEPQNLFRTRSGKPEAYRKGRGGAAKCLCLPPAAFWLLSSVFAKLSISRLLRRSRRDLLWTFLGYFACALPRAALYSQLASLVW